MKYGTRVFERLLPIFEASVCEHYKTDFLVHDRHMLEGTATPGMRYLLLIRPTGTSLLADCRRMMAPALAHMIAHANHLCYRIAPNSRALAQVSPSIKWRRGILRNVRGHAILAQ